MNTNILVTDKQTLQNDSWDIHTLSPVISQHFHFVNFCQLTAIISCQYAKLMSTTSPITSGTTRSRKFTTTNNNSDRLTAFDPPKRSYYYKHKERSACIGTDRLMLAAAACCDMGWISAQRGVLCDWSVSKDWKHVLTQKVVTCLQCFDAVGWVAGRASGL